MTISRWQVFVAFFLAVVIHSGAGFWLFKQDSVSGALSQGIGGLTVALGPAGGPPGAEVTSADDIDEAQTVEATSTEEAADVVEAEAVRPLDAEVEAVDESQLVNDTTPVQASEPVEAQSTPPLESTETEVVDAVVGEHPNQQAAIAPDLTNDVSVPKDISAEEPTPTQSVAAEEVSTVQETEVIKPAEIEEAEPPAEEVLKEVAVVDTSVKTEAAVVETPPTPVQKPRPPVVKPKAESATKPPAKPTPEKSSTTPTKTASKTPPSIAGSAGQAGSGNQDGTGSSTAFSGGGNPGTVVDYMAQLKAWLESHKTYPRRAQRRRQEGVVQLYFVMDSAGRVLDYRIERSSGHSALDRAVEEMIQKAQPLPAIPDELGRERLELVVPVQFSLK